MLAEDFIPIGFEANLFTLSKKDKVRERLYHGSFIFNGRAYDGNINVINKKEKPHGKG